MIFFSFEKHSFMHVIMMIFLYKDLVHLPSLLLYYHVIK